MLAAGPAGAERLRLATWDAGLSREGPGLVYEAITRNDAQVAAAVAVMAALDADVLLLTGVDYDAGGLALTALADRLAAAGAAYPHRLALRPNAGVATGLDLDGNGRRGEPRDAMGYGRFAGEGGMALLSRRPLDEAGVVDLTGLLWADLPGNLMPQGEPAAVRAVQRLSSTGHWAVPLLLPGGGRLTLLAFAATPPVFDGPEDRNGRRNHDETALWLRLLEGALPVPAPQGPVAVLGKINLDPADGDGRPQALTALLHHQRLQDPQPRGRVARSDPGQQGDPALDTALFGGTTGGLRVDYVLPPAGYAITGAGVMWPGPDDPLTAKLTGDLTAASRHYPVWVDLDLP